MAVVFIANTLNYIMNPDKLLMPLGYKRWPFVWRSFGGSEECLNWNSITTDLSSDLLLRVFFFYYSNKVSQLQYFLYDSPLSSEVKELCIAAALVLVGGSLTIITPPTD